MDFLQILVFALCFTMAAEFESLSTEYMNRKVLGKKLENKKDYHLDFLTERYSPEKRGTLRQVLYRLLFPDRTTTSPLVTWDSKMVFLDDQEERQEILVLKPSRRYTPNCKNKYLKTHLVCVFDMKCEEGNPPANFLKQCKTAKLCKNPKEWNRYTATTKTNVKAKMDDVCYDCYKYHTDSELCNEENWGKFCKQKAHWNDAKCISYTPDCSASEAKKDHPYCRKCKDGKNNGEADQICSTAECKPDGKHRGLDICENWIPDCEKLIEKDDEACIDCSEEYYKNNTKVCPPEKSNRQYTPDCTNKFLKTHEICLFETDCEEFVADDDASASEIVRLKGLQDLCNKAKTCEKDVEAWNAKTGTTVSGQPAVIDDVCIDCYNIHKSEKQCVKWYQDCQKKEFWQEIKCVSFQPDCKDTLQKDHDYCQNCTKGNDDEDAQAKEKCAGKECKPKGDHRGLDICEKWRAHCDDEDEKDDDSCVDCSDEYYKSFTKCVTETPLLTPAPDEEGIGDDSKEDSNKYLDRTHKRGDFLTTITVPTFLVITILVASLFIITHMPKCCFGLFREPDWALYGRNNLEMDSSSDDLLQSRPKLPHPIKV